MAITSVDDALTQFNENLSWHESRDSAKLALEAVRYLLVNRANQQGDQGSMMSFESLRDQETKLERFLGAGAARAFGRSRRNGVAFQEGGIQ